LDAIAKCALLRLASRGERQHHAIRVHRGGSHRISTASGRPAGGTVGPDRLRRAEFERFGASAGVDKRRIALPLSQYGQLSGFTESNDIFIETALELGERALLSAFDAAKVKPAEVDIVFSTTVTGLAVPTLEARLATRIGLRPDVKRVPLFGLGCVAGAAG
jgi:predicted naringenin-chalcone synthase